MSFSNDPRQSAYKENQLELLAEYLKPAIIQSLREGTRSCMTCDNFDEKTEICKVFNQRPPARIIAFGCDHYEDQVPF